MQVGNERARCEVFEVFDNYNYSLGWSDIWIQTIAIKYQNWWFQQELVTQSRLADVVKCVKATYLYLILSDGI